MDDSTSDIQTVLKRLDRALERIDELEAENARLREQVEELEHVKADNQRLRRRVQDLEHKLAQDSSNSHRPPSTDDPWDDDGDDEVVFDIDEPRNQGAQSGHEGHHRELLDVDEVDEVVAIKPEECSGCGAHLCGDDIAPWRHQVFEVEVNRRVIEYRMHRLGCDECGHSERGDLPDGVPHSAFGDSVCAWVSWPGGEFDLSRRDLQAVVERGFDIPISLGSVCALDRRTRRALGPAHAEALEALVDATGTDSRR